MPLKRRSDPSVKVFQYLPDLDAFLVTEAYRAVSDLLGLSDWTPVVWIGRLFALDNDFGEHWLDNWDLVEAKRAQAEQLGLEAESVLVLNPARFKRGPDGPCHSDQVRKLFWTDVLQGLELSYDVLFTAARERNERYRRTFPEDFLEDLEQRIARIARTPPRRLPHLQRWPLRWRKSRKRLSPGAKDERQLWFATKTMVGFVLQIGVGDFFWEASLVRDRGEASSLEEAMRACRNALERALPGLERELRREAASKTSG